MSPLPQLVAAALFLAAPVLSKAQRTEAGAQPSSPLAPLEFLVGGTWSADLPASPDGQSVILESQFEWTPNRQAVRFDSAWIIAGKRHPYASGMYAWDPGQRQLAVWYTDAAGSLTEGTVEPADGSLLHNLTVTDSTGYAESVRARFTQVGANGYRNEISTLKGTRWEKLVTVLYRRPDATAPTGK